MAWQSLDPIRKIITGRTIGIKFELIEFKPSNWAVALGGGTVTGGTAVGTYTFPAAGENTRRAVTIDANDGTASFRFFFPVMQQTGDITIPISRQDVARVPCEFVNVSSTVQPVIFSTRSDWLAGS